MTLVNLVKIVLLKCSVPLWVAEPMLGQCLIMSGTQQALIKWQSSLHYYLAWSWPQAETYYREGRGGPGFCGSGECAAQCLSCRPSTAVLSVAQAACCNPRGPRVTSYISGESGESSGSNRQLQREGDTRPSLRTPGREWLTLTPSLCTAPMCSLLSTWACFCNFFLCVFSSHRSSTLTGERWGMPLGCEGASPRTVSAEMQRRAHVTMSVVKQGFWAGSMWNAFWLWEQLGFSPAGSSQGMWFWRAERTGQGSEVKGHINWEHAVLPLPSSFWV